MKKLDTMGQFWLLGYEEEPLPGKLEFDPTGNGINLSLIGSFKNVPRDAAEADIRILGICDSGSVTLDRCIPRGTTYRSSGLDECRYLANQVFMGHHFEKPEVEVSSVTIRVNRLSDWVSQSGIIKEYTPRETSPEGPSRYTTTCTSAGRESSKFTRGTVLLDSHWQDEATSDHEVRLNYWHTIRIEYQVPQDFNVAQHDVSRLQNLITMCMDSFAEVIDFKLEAPDVNVEMLDGSTTEIPQSIEFLAPTIHPRSKGKSSGRTSPMFINFTEAGGIATLARWIDGAEIFQQPLNSMMSIRHASQMFMENKFLNVVHAAEAFHQKVRDDAYMDEETFAELLRSYIAITPLEHRDWVKGKLQFINSPGLTKRMRHLAKSAGPGIRGLIGNIDHWSFAVAGTRNELTHLGRKSDQLAGRDLFYLSESVYAVVRNCMLIESGVPQDELARKVDSDALTWYADRLHATIERVRRQLRES